ncbi:MAG: hypothetical protein ACO3K7_05750 [Candidatus Marinamargulisbacteria bacterium]
MKQRNFSTSISFLIAVISLITTTIYIPLFLFLKEPILAITTLPFTVLYALSVACVLTHRLTVANGLIIISMYGSISAFGVLLNFESGLYLYLFYAFMLSSLLIKKNYFYNLICLFLVSIAIFSILKEPLFFAKDSLAINRSKLAQDIILYTSFIGSLSSTFFILQYYVKKIIQLEVEKKEIHNKILTTEVNSLKKCLVTLNHKINNTLMATISSSNALSKSLDDAEFNRYKEIIKTTSYDIANLLKKLVKIKKPAEKEYGNGIFMLDIEMSEYESE